MTRQLALLLLVAWSDSYAKAAIQVENQSGYSLRFSLQGEACKLFDGDRYDYAPCEEKIIGTNQSVSFVDSHQDSQQTLTKRDNYVFPRIIFHWFGLSYLCRLDTQSFSCLEARLEKAELSPSPILLKLGGTGLTLKHDYRLLISSGYGYFPQPYIDCFLTKNP